MESDTNGAHLYFANNVECKHSSVELRAACPEAIKFAENPPSNFDEHSLRYAPLGGKNILISKTREPL